MHRPALLSLLTVVLLLSGCSPLQKTAIAMHPPASPFTVLLLADGVSVINTHKTLEDHIVSWISGQDCSLVRASLGENYCLDTTPPVTVKITTYCYKSIARVSCYDAPLPVDRPRYFGLRADQVPVATP